MSATIEPLRKRRRSIFRPAPLVVYFLCDCLGNFYGGRRRRRTCPSSSIYTAEGAITSSGPLFARICRSIGSSFHRRPHPVGPRENDISTQFKSKQFSSYLSLRIVKNSSSFHSFSSFPSRRFSYLFEKESTRSLFKTQLWDFFFTSFLSFALQTGNGQVN